MLNQNVWKQNMSKQNMLKQNMSIHNILKRSYLSMLSHKILQNTKIIQDA